MGIKIGILNNPYFSRIAYNTSWALAGTIIGRGSSFLASVVAARLLEVTGFGQLGMIRSSIGAFGVIAGLGLGITATRHVAIYKDNAPHLAGEIICLCDIIAITTSAIMAIALFFASPYLARTSLADPALAEPLRIGALMLLFTSLTSAGAGILIGFEGFRALAMISAAEGIATLIFTVPLTYYFGVKGAVFALVFGQITNLTLTRIKIRACCKQYAISVCTSPLRKHAKLLLNYSFPAFLCSFMYGPAIWILNQIVVSNPQGYQMLGLMGAADQLKTLILFVPASIGSVILPLMASVSKRNKEDYAKSIKWNYYSQITVACTLAIPIALLSVPLAGIYGKSYTGLAAVIVIMSITAVFHCAGNAAGNVLMAKSNTWPTFVINVLWAVCLILCGLHFIKIYGAVGLAVSYMIAHMFHALVTMIFVNRTSANTRI